MNILASPQNKCYHKNTVLKPGQFNTAINLFLYYFIPFWFCFEGRHSYKHRFIPLQYRQMLSSSLQMATFWGLVTCITNEQNYKVTNWNFICYSLWHRHQYRHIYQMCHMFQPWFDYEDIKKHNFLRQFFSICNFVITFIVRAKKHFATFL